MKSHKISTHLAYSDNCYFHLFFIGCLIELKFCKVSWNSIPKWTWKFQLSILKNKKVLFLKKNFLSRCQYQNKKSLFTDSIFQKVLDKTYSSGSLDFALPPTSFSFLPDQNHLAFLKAELLFTGSRVGCNHSGKLGSLSTLFTRL